MPLMLPLFVYGTLMWPDVLKTVIGRLPHMEDAVIEGYRRLKIKGVIYPALIRAPSYSVNGKLIRGLKYEELILIDSFEGNEYERKKVIVKTPDGKEEAYVYVFKDVYRDLLVDEDWESSEISDEVIRNFLKSE